MKRRNFIKMGAAIAGAAALAGCQSGGEDKSASGATGPRSPCGWNGPS